MEGKKDEKEIMKEGWKDGERKIWEKDRREREGNEISSGERKDVRDKTDTRKGTT